MKLLCRRFARESGMDVDKELDQRRLDRLAAIRVAFANGRYQEVMENFEQLGPLDTPRSGIRIEAIALAVRTQIALVARFIYIAGYRCLSLMRASGVVKCQLAF